MKKGRKLRPLPFTVTLTAVSFSLWLSGTICMQQERLQLTERIRDAERQIEGLEIMNDEIAAEVEHLRES